MIWSVTEGKAIVWTFANNKLYTAPSTSGQGHDSMHLANNLPRVGDAFDNVERGRALFTKQIKIIEVVSTGRNEWMSNRAFDAILKHFDAKESDDIVVLYKGWDRDEPQR